MRMTGWFSARRALTIGVIGVAAMMLSSCGLFDGMFERDPPPVADRAGANVVAKYQEARRTRPNVHAWQAARETLSLLKLRSEDAFGGVLATGWYRPKTAPNERLRVTVVIVSPELSNEAIKVSVIKQRQQGSDWQDVPVSASTVAAIHGRILRRAKELQAEAVR